MSTDLYGDDGEYNDNCRKNRLNHKYHKTMKIIAKKLGRQLTDIESFDVWDFLKVDYYMHPSKVWAKQWIYRINKK